MRTVLLAIALAAAACGATPPERQLLTDFFHAARLRDNTALANIATVAFNPRTDGTVVQFAIESIGGEENGAKDVTVTAQVRTPEGQTVPRTMIFTIQRDAAGRLMITGLRDL